MSVKDEWIPVSEKLPNKDGDYLVYTEWRFGGTYLPNISIASFATNLHKVDDEDFPCPDYKRPGWYDYDGEDATYYELSDITYWMPLPIPPRGI